MPEVCIPDTPEYLQYFDEDQNEVTFPNLDEEVTPEADNEYIHTSIIFAYGSVVGTVMAQKQDTVMTTPLVASETIPSWLTQT